MYFSPLEFYYEFTIDVNKEKSQEVNKSIDKIITKTYKEIPKYFTLIGYELLKVNHLYCIFKLSENENYDRYYVKGIRFRVIADYYLYENIMKRNDVARELMSESCENILDENGNPYLKIHLDKSILTEEESKKLEKLNNKRNYYLKINDYKFNHEKMEYQHYWDYDVEFKDEI
jgi:hypothetical protein